MMPNLAPRTAKIIAIVLAVLAVLALVGAVRSCSSYKSTAKLGTEQAGAAIESGKSAVNTVGNRQEAELSGAANVQETQSAINNATNVSGATGAGLDGLHNVRGRPSPDPRR